MDRENMGGRWVGRGGILLALGIFCWCAASLWLVPPLQSPDGADHIQRAYLLARGRLIMEAPGGRDSGGRVDLGLLAYADHYKSFAMHPERKIVGASEARLARVGWDTREEFRAFAGAAYYFPLIYAPQALGLAAGRALGLSVGASVMLARCLALLASMGLVLWGFVIFRPPPLVVAVMALPMTMFMLASTNVEGVTAGLVVLAISLFMALAGEERGGGAAGVIGLTAVVALAAMGKIHLAPLVLLLFGLGWIRGQRRWLAAGLVACALILGWLVVALGTVEDHRIVDTMPPLQVLGHYLGHPADLLGVFVETLSNRRLVGGYVLSFVGILGSLDIRFAWGQYYLMTALLALAAAASIVPVAGGADGRARLVLLGGATCSVLLVFLALLLTWTPHPATCVLGVQGRYFLGAALMAAYALGGMPRARRPLFEGLGLALAAVLFAYGAWATSALMQERFFTPSAPAALSAAETGRAEAPGALPPERRQSEVPQ